MYYNMDLQKVKAQKTIADLLYAKKLQDYLLTSQKSLILSTFYGKENPYIYIYIIYFFIYT